MHAGGFSGLTKRAAAGLCALVVAVMPLGAGFDVAYGDPGMSAATADGTAFAKDQKTAAVNVPDQTVTVDVVPGSQAAPADMTGLYQSSDVDLKNAGTAATTNDAFTSMVSADANRNTVDLAPLKAMRDDAQEIIDAAPTALDPSLQPSGTSGKCEEVASTPLTQTYEATCDTGTEVVSSSPVMIYSCPTDFTLVGTSCAKTTTEPPTVTYSCPGGGTLDGGQCVTSQPATVSGYTCPIGFTLNGSTCERTLQQPVSVTGYTCPTGFNLNGTTCTQTIQQPATPSYSCPGGYSLAGSQCTMGSSYPAVNTYTCPSGYDLNGSTCTQTVSNPATASLSCSGSDVLQGSACIHGEHLDPLATYTCPRHEFLEADNTCSGGSSPIAHYYCEGSDTLIPNGMGGQTCLHIEVLPPNTTYSCPNGGALVGSVCQTTDTQPATGTLSCPSGGTLNGSVCDNTVTQPADVSYSCPTGFDVAGSLCTQTVSVVATPVMSCDSGYTLNGSLCERHEAQPAAPAYTCPAGFNLDGTNCVQMVTATAARSCSPGFDLIGSVCSQTIVQPASGALGCPNGSTMDDGVCQTLTPGHTDCAALVNNPLCVLDHDECLDDPQVGACKVKESIYKCPVPGSATPASKQYLCAGDIYCINGDCQTVDRDTGDDFKDAMVALNTMNEVGKEFDPSNFTVFKGERDTCHKSVLGIVNCCAGKSAGMLTGADAAAAKAAIKANTDITHFASHSLFAFLCSKDEKQLDVKDRLGLCHNVGTYCSSSVLGVCITKKTAYCCYGSKLSRILQEQGRPQIGKPWDKPKKEQCLGFTIDEFSHLDLSRMDFTEVYAEFTEAAKLPDEVEMTTDIQAKIHAYYDTSGHPGP